MKYNCQEVVNEIQLFLDSDDRQLNDRLGDLSQKYNVCCSEVNARLQRCGEFLRKDLRSEAIQEAEMSPILLEMVYVLDFPDIGDWEGVSLMYDLQPPTGLLSKVVRALEEAYTEHQPLEELLDQHRLLSLSMAPLTDRIQVLRQLATKDNLSIHWETDLAAFERVRHEQIETEVREAATAGDLRQINLLVDEMRSDKWHEFPPEELLTSVRRIAAISVKKLSLKELRRLEPEIVAASEIGDFAQLQTLRSEWNTIAPKARLSPNDELNTRVQPIFTQLADEETRQADDAEFTSRLTALQVGACSSENIQELEQLYANVVSCGRAIPDESTQQYRERIQFLRKRVALIKYRKIGIFAAAIVVLGGVFWIVAASQGRTKQRENMIADVNALADAGKFEDAINLAEKYPQFADAPHVLQMLIDIRSKHDKDRQRQVDRKRNLESAKNAITHSEADRLLSKAEGLSLPGAELKEVLLVRREVDTSFHRMRTEIEADFEERLNLYQSDYRPFEVLASHVPWDEGKKITYQQLSSTLSSMIVETEKFPTELKSHAESVEKLKNALQKLQLVHTESMRQEAFLTEMTLIFPLQFNNSTSQNELKAFKENLKTFSEKWPEHPLSKDFRSVLKTFVQVEVLSDWQRFVAHSSEVLTKSPIAASQRLTQIKSLLEEHPQFVQSELTGKYEEYLSAIAKRSELKNDIRKFFQSPLIDGALMLESRDGKKYYLSEQAKSVSDTVRAKYFIDNNGNETPSSRILPENNLKRPKAIPSPQSELAKVILPGLKVSQIEDWESFWTNTAEIIRVKKNMDEVLQYTMLQRVLEAASDGSLPLKVTLERALGQFNDVDINTEISWMDPDNRNAARERVTARRVISRINSLTSEKIAQQIGDETKILRKRFSQQISLVGWLAKTDSGKWVCRTNRAASVDYSLRVMNNSDPKKPSWQTVGTFKAEQGVQTQNGWQGLQLDSPLPQTIRIQGTPVFGFLQQNTGRGQAAPTISE